MAILFAVAELSPVIITTLIPAYFNPSTVILVSFLNGSKNSKKPNNVKFFLSNSNLLFLINSSTFSFFKSTSVYAIAIVLPS